MFDRLKSLVAIDLRGFVTACVIFLFSLSFYGQTTYPSNRYYQVIVNDIKVSQHLTQLKAEQILNCRDGYIIPPTGKVLTEPLVYCPPPPPPPCPEMKVDTIYRIVHTYGGVVKPTQVILDDCREVYITEKLDNVAMIQDPEYGVALQRIVSYKDARTYYRLLGQRRIYSDLVTATVFEITSTTAKILIKHTSPEVEEMLIEFYGTDKVIQKTSQGALNIQSLLPLKSKELYHFRVYGLKDNKVILVSSLYNFTTT